MRGMVCGLLVALFTMVAMNSQAGERQVYFLGGGAPPVKDNIDVSGWKKFDVKYECWQNNDCSWLIEMFRGTTQVSKAEGQYKSSRQDDAPDGDVLCLGAR